MNMEVPLKAIDRRHDVPVVPAPLGGRHADGRLPPPVRPLAHLRDLPRCSRNSHVSAVENE